MKQHRFRAAALTAALLSSTAVLSGCYKSDGASPPPGYIQTVPVQEDSYADQKDAAFTDVTVDENASSDYPFPFSAAEVQEPAQDIVLVLIYDNTEQPHSHTQTVNYYDKNGNAYRYRQPLDLSGDWFSVLHDHRESGATVVNMMSTEEIQTVRYLANNADTYAAAMLKPQDTGKEVFGVWSLYLMNAQNEPILLAQYDDISQYRDNSEAVAFVNWFRYFYHSEFQFGG